MDHVELELKQEQQRFTPHLGAKGVKREIAEQTGMVKRLVRPGDYRSALLIVLVVRCQSDLLALALPHFQLVSVGSVKKLRTCPSALRTR
eukprot:3790562-Heterocapsa_arctica.AAC.1